MRTTYYTASSADGFIADEQDSLDWLFVQDQGVMSDGPLNYQTFIAGIGVIAMGATTYTWVAERLKEGERWPYQQPCWVFTHRDLPRVDGDIRFVSGSVEPVHAEMVAAAEGTDAWLVGGGDLAGQFADAGLLDEMIVSFAAVTLGAGRPLFPRRFDLELLELERNRAFGCARYRVVGPGNLGE